MKTVFLTVGTRAAGKTTYCKAQVARDHSLVCVSRDDVLMKLFGTASLDPYCGGHDQANITMWKMVEKALEETDVKIILDAWNGNSSERRYILSRLRSLGAERIVAWYFVTPVELVSQWFWKKPGIARISEMKSRRGEKNLAFYSVDAPEWDHEHFHKCAAGIETDGFDEVVRIDPAVVQE